MKKYEYGKSPNPKNWREAAEALKSLKKKRPLTDRLDAIEKLLKDKK